MSDDLSADDFKAYFSEDETEVYVLTDSLPKLKLKDTPEQREAPLYMDLETGEGVYPEEVSPGEAADAARYAIDQSSDTTLFHLSRDNEQWRREFSELFDQAEKDLGSAWSLDLDERGNSSYEF